LKYTVFITLTWPILKKNLDVNVMKPMGSTLSFKRDPGILKCT